ncbi:MAG: ABC transporter ATP-binding protein [Pseudomonadota bacterium]
MSLVAKDVQVDISGCAIVHSANLTLAPGELVGLIGPNGAGKTTLLKAILGLRPPTSGDVHINGETTTDLSSKAFARQVAYLPQDHHVEWDLTVRDVVELGRHPHRGRFGGKTADCDTIVETCLREVELPGLADRKFAVLSGGEKARVLLARALAVRAPYLLADEPVAALDPYHQLHVMELLRARAKAGDGVLTVLHDLTLAARFLDRVVIMDAGEIVCDGPPGDVLTTQRLESVYGVTPLMGEADGTSWLIPWQRRRR